MGATGHSARPMNLVGRASFLTGMACLLSGVSWSMDTSDRRVAAIIAAGTDSMVLIEDSAGKQDWHRVGDVVGDARIDYIDPDWIRLSAPEGDVRWYLRGDKYKESTAQAGESAKQPPREVSHSYRYVNLISRVDSASPAQRGSSEQTNASSLNKIFGLAERAKITAINRVEVGTVAEARAELRNQLLKDEPIRISIDNAYTRALYLVPE